MKRKEADLEKGVIPREEMPLMKCGNEERLATFLQFIQMAGL